MRTTRGDNHGGGRHRPGAARLPWARIPWDVRERAAAAGLDMLEPHWMVMYRPWARKFYAVPAWPLPGWLDVEAATVTGLQARMRQAEASPYPPARHTPVDQEEAPRHGN